MEDKILVHICCGVDAVWALRKIKEEFPNSEIKGFFYDPNIHPEEEYELRWIETLRVCNSLGIECIKGDYEVDRWLKATKGLENEPERGSRCSVCHDLRLEETAILAKRLGFNKITTVLMMSPKKDFEVLKSIGEAVADKYDLEFLAIDFRKKGGVEKMNKFSKEYQLYHQNYCGCIYALFQHRDRDYIPELVSYGKGRLAGSREELLFVKQIRLFAESLGLKCEEQEFRFIGWKLISSSMKIDKEPVLHTVLPYSASIKGILRGKVKEIYEDWDRKVIKLNKGNVEIWILDKLREISLEEPRLFTDPVFIVDRDISSEAKIELQLKTEFDPEAKSTNLIIGDIYAPEKVEFHSDTLIDGSSGCEIDEIKGVLLREKEKIIKSEIAVIVYGAHNYGKLGERFLEKREKSLKKL
ncbi:epoxyqueuosine reductase QueH [Persephonella sp.]